MPRAEKSSYDQKHKREARPIESSYTKHGPLSQRAARMAWAMVNKPDGDGRTSH